MDTKIIIFSICYLNELPFFLLFFSRAAHSIDFYSRNTYTLLCTRHVHSNITYMNTNLERDRKRKRKIAVRENYGPCYIALLREKAHRNYVQNGIKIKMTM